MGPLVKPDFKSNIGHNSGPFLGGPKQANAGLAPGLSSQRAQQAQARPKPALAFLLPRARVMPAPISFFCMSHRPCSGPARLMAPANAPSSDLHVKPAPKVAHLHDGLPLPRMHAPCTPQVPLHASLDDTPCGSSPVLTLPCMTLLHVVFDLQHTRTVSTLHAILSPSSKPT